MAKVSFEARGAYDFKNYYATPDFDPATIPMQMLDCWWSEKEGLKAFCCHVGIFWERLCLNFQTHHTAAGQLRFYLAWCWLVAILLCWIWCCDGQSTRILAEDCKWCSCWLAAHASIKGGKYCESRLG